MPLQTTTPTLMKFTQLRLMILLGFLAMTMSVHATHYMGGEITWECTPAGDFRFTLKLYRECYTSNGGQSANFGATVILNSTAPGFASITMTRISITDLSPQCGCPGGPTIYCPGMSAGAANMGALQEHLYTSDANYPNGVPLTGVPPATGWSFSNSSCCRNSSANIPGQPGWWIRAMMYPYNNNNVNNCFDNSPRFAERPSTVICSGYPYSYQTAALDNDNDSLAYEWAQPYSGGNTPIANYSPGYSYNSPLPGVFHNPGNVPATIDPLNGVVSFTSYTNGAFVTVVKITAFKNGIKVAEIFRELQVVLLACGSNNPPVVNIPLSATAIGSNWYTDTVIAGSVVNLPISFLDLDKCQDSLQTPQTMRFTASGTMLDSNINPGGCPFPPCAGFNPSPTPGNPLIASVWGYSVFTWNTGFFHLENSGGLWMPKTYHFWLKVWDDFCPAPAIRNILLSICVKPPVEKSQPEIRCIDVIPNGDVTLRWTPPVAPSGWVSGYTIEHSGSVSGPFVTIGNLTNASATSFTHTGAGANLSDAFYRVNAHYTQPVAGIVAPSHMARSIKLSAQVTTPALKNILLTWQPTLTNLSAGSTGVYEVYRESSPGQWTLFKTVSALTCTDTATYQGQTIRYKVLTANTHSDPGLGISPCSSSSNIASVFLSQVEEMDSQENEIRVFPNPGNGLFTLMPGSLSGFSSLRVFDLQGKMVFSSNPVLASGEPLELDMRILTPGTYFLNIECGDQCFATRMMIE